MGLNTGSAPEFSEQILLHKLRNELAGSFDRIFDRPNVTIFNGKSYRATGKKEKRIEDVKELRL